jgi:hypothetical protein
MCFGDRTVAPTSWFGRRNNQNEHCEFLVSFLRKFIAHTLPTFAVRPAVTKLTPAIDRPRAVPPLWKTDRNQPIEAMVVSLTRKNMYRRHMKSSSQIYDFNVFVRYTAAEKCRAPEMCPGANTVARTTSVFSSTRKLFFNFSLGSFLGS